MGPSGGGGGGGHGGLSARLSPRGTSVGGGGSALPGYHHVRGGGGGGGPGGVALGSPQESARSPRGGGFGSGQNTGRMAFAAGEEGLAAVGGGILNMGNSHKQLINPTTRHQEARQRFETEMASKLMQVIDKKKLSNLQVRRDRECVRVVAVLPRVCYSRVTQQCTPSDRLSATCIKKS